MSNLRIPHVQRILLFEKERSIRRVLELRCVSAIFADCVENYMIWHELFPSRLLQQQKDRQRGFDDDDDDDIDVDVSQEKSTSLTSNVTSSKLKDLLTRAASIGSLSLVRSLLSDRRRRLDANALSPTFGSPLIAAVRHNHLGVSKLLLSHGADPAPLQGEDGDKSQHPVHFNYRIALHEARSAEAAQMLVAHIHSPNEKKKTEHDPVRDILFRTDVSLATPLAAAAMRGNVDVVRFLLPLYVRYSDPMAAPDALRKGEEHFLKNLSEQERALVFFQDNTQETREESIFSCAVRGGSLEIVRMLLAASKDKFFRVSDVTAAARAGSLDILQELVLRSPAPPIPPKWVAQPGNFDVKEYKCVPYFFKQKWLLHALLGSRESVFSHYSGCTIQMPRPCFDFLVREIERRGITYPRAREKWPTFKPGDEPCQGGRLKFSTLPDEIF